MWGAGGPGPAVESCRPAPGYEMVRKGKGAKMPEWLTNLFSLSREISSKVALPIAVTLGLVLFLPDPFAGYLGITEFRDTYRIWVGVLFLLAVAALLSNALWLFGRSAKSRFSTWRLLRAARRSLSSLTNEEKEILREFVMSGKASVTKEISGGAINLLANKQIVSRASTVSVIGTKWNYVLHPWARSYLEKNRHLLE